jgi:hypothetical protein
MHARNARRFGCSAFLPGRRGRGGLSQWMPLLDPRSKSARSNCPGDSRAARRACSARRPVRRARRGGLRDELSGRFAFFGYSMGSLVAFGSPGCCGRTRIEPEWLFVAAHGAPQLPRRAPAMAGAPGSELLDFFQHTYGPLPADSLPRALPAISEILRADVSQRYAYAAEDPLGARSAFGGPATNPRCTPSSAPGRPRPRLTSPSRCFQGHFFGKTR